MAPVNVVPAGEITLLEHETSDFSSDQLSCLSWSQWHKHFLAHFTVRFVTLNDVEAEFDLVGGGMEAPLVNSFRRLLLSDVPSMAIETVFISNNTSVLQDEVLAHRLGLVPLRASPLLFEYRCPGEAATAANTLQFQLKVKCSRQSAGAQAAGGGGAAVKKEEGKLDAAPLCVTNQSVYSKSLRLLPLPGQEDLFTDDNAGPVHDDILLARLRPGHEIDLRVEAVKSCGRDHAKFSPVATAWYRLLPTVRLTRRVCGEQARRLAGCFSAGVIELRPVQCDKGGRGGDVEAVVVDARYDNCSRNALRYDDLRDAVQLGRVKDHFIFTVESVGAQPPDKLFVEAARLLVAKCRRLISALDSTQPR